MGWQESSIVEQRFEFVVLASAEGANVAALCRRFGISRETGHKWIGRFKAGGKASLEDRSRRPAASPDKTPDDVEAAVLALRAKHPAWGGRKLRARLRALGREDAPAASTITAILRRHGRLNPAESGKHIAQAVGLRVDVPDPGRTSRQHRSTEGARSPAHDSPRHHSRRSADEHPDHPSGHRADSTDVECPATRQHTTCDSTAQRAGGTHGC
jgi:transposase-like protein